MNDEDRLSVVDWKAEIGRLSNERHDACKALALLENDQMQRAPGAKGRPDQPRKADLTRKISNLDKQIAERRGWIEEVEARRKG